MARDERKKIQQQDLDSVRRKAFEVEEEKNQVSLLLRGPVDPMLIQWIYLGPWASPPLHSKHVVGLRTQRK